jgi:hypothetical protein
MNNLPSETFYRRKTNGRYEAVRQWDPVLQGSFPLGTTVVVAHKDVQLRRYNQSPDYLALTAAALSVEDRLARIISKCSSWKRWYPEHVVPGLSAADQALYARILESGALGRLVGPSAQEIAEQILQVLVDTAKPVVDIPWVQELALQYQAAVLLTIQNHD